MARAYADDPEYAAYYAQKYAAGQRGIGWEFTFEDWVNWWEEQLGYNWMKKRGCLRGEYVMARKGDKGPYARWNVECKTNTQNHTDKVINGSSARGEGHGMVKLTEGQAKEIYLAPGAFSALARQYGVHRDTIIAIKKGRLWKHFTAELGPAYFNPKRRRPTGEHFNSENRKLTEELVKQIFYATGGRGAIARAFNVSGPTVRKIKQRTTWRHITSTL